MKPTDLTEFGFPKCIGCGYCCHQAMCYVAAKQWFIDRKDGDEAPKICPNLFWNGEQYRCKIAADHIDDLAIGAGCSSSLNSWRKEVKKRD